jgi:hypothetical protein
MIEGKAVEEALSRIRSKITVFDAKVLPLAMRLM